uniref:RWD domain-containing protein 3 n=1 Tax=Sinocyclocheilus rhinocerous TaxID=307959 RepID=A0A673KSR0_9TELE
PCGDFFFEISRYIYIYIYIYGVYQTSTERGIVYRIHTLIGRNNGKTPLALTFHICPDYPHTPPDVSITSSRLSRKQCQDLRQHLLDTARSLPPEPMVHDLMLWLQENFSDLIKTSKETWTVLRHLDYIRSKAKYIKLIEKWTSELCLTGRLFMGKPILIFLQGTKENIKVFDVVSSGKRCKEKIMSILCEIQQPEEHVAEICMNLPTAAFKLHELYKSVDQVLQHDLRRSKEYLCSSVEEHHLTICIKIHIISVSNSFI